MFDPFIGSPGQVLESGPRDPNLAPILLPVLQRHVGGGLWRVIWGCGSCRVQRVDAAGRTSGFRLLEDHEGRWYPDVGYRYDGPGAIRLEGHALGRTVPDTLVPIVEELEDALLGTREGA
jgi:hypothetical protein